MSAWTAEDGHPTAHFYPYVYRYEPTENSGYMRSNWTLLATLISPGEHTEWRWRIDAVVLAGGASRWNAARADAPDPLARSGIAPTEEAARDACNTAVATMVLSGLVRPL